MSTFTVEEITGLPPSPVEPFYKLIVDGKCHFDEFWEKMEKSGNQKKMLDKIQTIISLKSQGIRLPSSQFQELKNRGKDDPYPDYEIRAKQLRLYLFDDSDSGKIIVLGEVKKGWKTQSKSIKKMRELKLAYFKQR
ncbi:hypothetical protein [Phaeodactylibacter xiamenensis]|uniref:hypothetical protein n=1 Tax=Phaeodactylibacter xiamenensis TaxID=1524460 RepID=UPI0024A97404|nr:hypothetical protein [Phaeodactylibacter xiamenensis]